MQSMLKERDAMRARDDRARSGRGGVPADRRVRPAHLRARPRRARRRAGRRPSRTSHPRRRRRSRPGRTREWTPPEPVPAPEFIPASSTFDLPSFDEGDAEGFPAPPMPPLDFRFPPPDTPMGDGKCILLQGFNWESCNSHKKWFNVVADEARQIRDAGFTAVWLPPPTDSVSDQGYLLRSVQPEQLLRQRRVTCAGASPP